MKVKASKESSPESNGQLDDRHSGSSQKMMSVDGANELRAAVNAITEQSAYGLDPSDPQTSLLSQAEALEEAGTSRFIRSILILGGGFILMLIVWASATNLDEVARAPATVEPAQSVKHVEHLEGGIVAKILVRDGDLVRKGQTLIQLRSKSFRSELLRFRARKASLVLKSKRLFTFATGRPFIVSTEQKGGRFRKLYLEEIAMLEQQTKTRRARREVFLQQIAQKHAELAVLKEAEKSLKAQLIVVKESYDLRGEGNRKGVVSRAVYLQTKREYERMIGELNGIGAKYRRAKVELAAQKARAAESESRMQSDAFEERRKALAALAEVKEKLADLEDRVRRLTIRAPITGYVKGLTVKTEGAVLTNNGKSIMEIVPVDRDFVIEARISTRDVGHVQLGQPVRVKIDTFDHVRYGSLSGSISKISATSFLTKNGQPYYRATIIVKNDNLTDHRQRLTLSPGMTATAEVITGSKSLLSYLLKPVYAAIDAGMTER